MEDRRRIVREIRRNAALVFRCEASAVSISFDRDDEAKAWRAIVSGPNGARLEAAGSDANESLVALLNLVIDRANGDRIEIPLTSPELLQAMRLLQMKRRELIEQIRAELDAQETEPEKKS